MVPGAAPWAGGLIAQHPEEEMARPGCLRCWSSRKGVVYYVYPVMHSTIK